MTEKDYNPEQRNKKVGENNKAIAKASVSKAPEKIASAKAEENKEIINKEISAPKSEAPKVEDTKSKPAKKQITKPKVKKNDAMVNGSGLPLSTKVSVAICKFIKGKQIPQAIADLEQVVIKKKAVPMKGEIPHRKGKIMSGRFPGKAAEYFIRMLKNLQANANVNGLNEPVIAEAMANIASQPYGKFGRVRRKRTHVIIRVKEMTVKGGKKK
jgi:ribosomal protein L22